MNAYKNIKYFFDGYWKILITLYNLAMFKFSLMVKVQTVRFGWCFAVRLHAMQDNDYIWLYWWCDNFNTVNLGSIVCLLCITAQYVDLGCLGSFLFTVNKLILQFQLSKFPCIFRIIDEIVLHFVTCTCIPSPDVILYKQQVFFFSLFPLVVVILLTACYVYRLERDAYPLFRTLRQKYKTSTDRDPVFEEVAISSNIVLAC